MPTAEGKIINANDPWRCGRGNRSLMDETAEGRGAQTQVEAREKARTPFTTDGKGDRPRDLLGADSSPGIRTQKMR
jgi:hypothetical protein